MCEVLMIRQEGSNSNIRMKIQIFERAIIRVGGWNSIQDPPVLDWFSLCASGKTSVMSRSRTFRVSMQSFSVIRRWFPVLRRTRSTLLVAMLSNNWRLFS